MTTIPHSHLSDLKPLSAEKISWGEIPLPLSQIINHVILPSGLKMTAPPEREKESKEYGACQFELNGYRITFRIAHTTPTKTGQFVTLWKRLKPSETIAPIDVEDGISFIFIYVSDITNRGLFIFNRHLLARQGVMSVKGRGGKRALRVYPPWTCPTARQAMQTQSWQVQYFLPLQNPDAENHDLLMRLFNSKK